jgi:hypothetical protein
VERQIGTLSLHAHRGAEGMDRRKEGREREREEREAVLSLLVTDENAVHLNRKKFTTQTV